MQKLGPDVSVVKSNLQFLNLYELHTASQRSSTVKGLRQNLFSKLQFLSLYELHTASQRSSTVKDLTQNLFSKLQFLSFNHRRPGIDRKGNKPFPVFTHNHTVKPFAI